MRSPTQLLSSAWDLYTANLKLLFSIYIIPAVIAVFITAWFGIGAESVRIEELRTEFSIIQILILLVILMLTHLLMGVALVLAISVPDQTTLKTAYTFALRKLVPYMILSLISGILIFFGLVLLIIPGVILLVWFIFSQLILLLEDRSPIDALKTSREYVRGKWFKIAGRLGFLILVTLVLSAVVALVAAFTRPLGEIAEIIITQLGNFVLVPLSIAYMYLFYRDAKIDYASTASPTGLSSADQSEGQTPVQSQDSIQTPAQ